MIILTLHLWEETFGEKTFSLKCYRKSTIGLEGLGLANLTAEIIQY